MQMTQSNFEFSQIDQNLSGFRDNSPFGPPHSRGIHRCEFSGQRSSTGYKEALQKFENKLKVHSPIRANRFKSTDRKAFLPVNSASENLHENTTNQSSNGISGKYEHTLDTSSKADPDLVIFENNKGNPSFSLGQAMINEYPEYSMLRKLRALVTSFTCNKCGKVLTFEKFFDDDHTCLLDCEETQSKVPQDDISLEVEEFKDPESALKLRETNTK